MEYYDVFRPQIANLRSISRVSMPNESMRYGLFVFVHNPFREEDVTGFLYYLGAYSTMELARKSALRIIGEIGYTEINIIHFGKAYPVVRDVDNISLVPEENVTFDVNEKVVEMEEGIFEKQRELMYEDLSERRRMYEERKKEMDENSREYLEKKVESLRKTKEKLEEYREQYEALMGQIRDHPQLPFIQFNPV